MTAASHPVCASLVTPQAVAVAGSLCTAGEGASSLLGGLLTAAFGFRSAYLVAACGMIAGSAAAYYYLPSDAELASGRAMDPLLGAAAAEAETQQGGDGGAGGARMKRGNSAVSFSESAQAAGSSAGGGFSTRPTAQLEMKQRRSGRRAVDGAGVDDAPGGAGDAGGELADNL